MIKSINCHVQKKHGIIRYSNCKPEPNTELIEFLVLIYTCKIVDFQCTKLNGKLMHKKIFDYDNIHAYFRFCPPESMWRPATIIIT